MREVDYIIVGAGSAGCVLANRLSADPDVSVLLLEAGGRDWNPLIHIPLGAGKLIRSSLHSWGYSTEPEPHLDDRRLPWARGKVLGGSSSTNSMVYVRGNPRDYDTWAQLGNRGWAWDDVLPYFRRSEGHVDRPADALHGTAGPLKVQRGRGDNPLYGAFVAAGVQAGMAHNDDCNGPEQAGVGRYDFTINDGRRASTSVCYLHPVMNRPNLVVETSALTHRVTLEGTQATGVEYARGGSLQRVRARRDVILAGGVMNSPHVLMLSGIGPGDQLTRHGITPRVDLPGVGRNLQDHLDVSLQYTCPEPVTLHSLIRLDRAALAMAQAALFRTGPAATFPAEGAAFLKTRPELETPDMQWHFLIGLGARRVRVPLLWHLWKDRLDQDGFSIRMCHLHPESRGHLELASADPTDRIRIFANYLATEADRQAFRDGIRRGRELVSQSALDRWRGAELSPGIDITSDAEIDAFVRRTAVSIYHPVGTCRMGSDGDAVVDQDLKVHGVTGLRVVDASIMPRITSGNTNAPTIMIAEKAADMILGRAAAPRAAPRAAA